MANKSKLGRGLDILLGQSIESPVQARSGDLLIQMKLDQLQRGQFQPRSKFNESKLDELTQSIASQGVIQPLVVREVAENKFEIIAGERRWRAAKQAGLNEVPVVVRDIDDQVALAIALIENIQRESLTPIEEAKALSRLIQDFKMTHEEISQVVGRSRSAVSRSEEHTSELQSQAYLVCRLLLEKKKRKRNRSEEHTPNSSHKLHSSV